MRHLLILLADAESGRGPAAPRARAAALDGAALEAYERELIRAGVLLAGESLAPAEEGLRVDCDGDSRTVAPVPPGASAPGVEAFWMLETGGMDEALEWARRIPLRHGTVEVRPVRDRAEPVRPVAVLRR